MPAPKRLAAPTYSTAMTRTRQIPRSEAPESALPIYDRLFGARFGVANAAAAADVVVADDIVGGLRSVRRRVLLIVAVVQAKVHAVAGVAVHQHVADRIV